MKEPLISICIPAYQRIHFLKRLLDSIAQQTFTDFEVIVTDDSPSNEVEQLCKTFASKFNLRYFRNAKALGTPENWNQAIRNAKGKWIKLMHDDDWFSSQESLNEFASAISRNDGIDFFFSAYKSINEKTGNHIQHRPASARLHRTKNNPAVLLAGNIIGPPSVTIYKNVPDVLYDSRLKWLVDIDFYMSYLRSGKFYFIDQYLINIGVSESQVTQFTFRVPEVEIPENFLVLQKIGSANLKDIFVFDAWWRLLRNLKISSVDSIRANGFKGEIPAPIMKIIRYQRRIPRSILHNGIASKTLMTLCFLL